MKYITSVNGMNLIFVCCVGWIFCYWPTFVLCPLNFSSLCTSYFWKCCRIRGLFKIP